jgi:hypothetical protein
LPSHCILNTETMMTSLKRLGAASLLILPLVTASSSFAASGGPGPCTPPGNFAVGSEGPAMSGGQLMAGVGQCQRIGGWDRARSARNDWGWNRGYVGGGYDNNGYNGGGYYNNYHAAPGWGPSSSESDH